MSAHSFVARMPDRPGSMERAAEIIKRHGSNIERILYDRRIDTQTVFFEVTCDEAALEAIRMTFLLTIEHQPWDRFRIAPAHTCHRSSSRRSWSTSGPGSR
jgi:hypothetical protein